MKINSQEYENAELKDGAGYEPIPADGYCIKITDVEDQPKYENLKIYFDVLEGNYKGASENLPDNMKFLNSFVVRYGTSTNGKSMIWQLKKFLSTIENENKGVKFDLKNDNFNEKELVGKVVGVVFKDRIKATENYPRTRSLMYADTLSLNDIRQGNYKVPPAWDTTEEDLKRINSNKSSTSSNAEKKDKSKQYDGDIPF